MSGVRGFFGELFLKRPARRRSIAEHLAALAKSGATFQARLARATPSDKNRTQLRHIIGIERWGQRRLGTILGEPPIDDEYDGYQPDAALDWSVLREEMARTRRETITLGDRIAERGIGGGVTAHHNSVGPLNAREWLQYLGTHASIEGLRVR